MAEEVIELEFDVRTLTLGELAEATEASGLNTRQLTGPYLLLLAVFVNQLRSSGPRLSWRDISRLQVSDIQSGPSPRSRGSRSPKSSASG